MNRKLAIAIAVVLIAVVVSSLFFASSLFSRPTSGREFFVGVECAYGGDNVGEVSALVDKVRDYTNLFVIGSVEVSFNRTALDESCDYVFASGLHFIVLFTSFTSYNYSNGYKITDWMVDAQQKYGDKFLGIFKIDEPGGNQVDSGPSMIINSSTSYAQVSQDYVGNMSAMINYYHPYTPRIFTADYALNWFDYKSNYTAVFAEFVGNESRQRIIGLDRGAAKAFNKDWGVIINWKYNQPPYLEDRNELYSDLSLAYSAGAKYAVVFSYPNTTAYGTLTEDHFTALKTFWGTLHSDPGSFGSNQPQVAYVAPKDYGFGFRRADDRIWGLFTNDTFSAKICNDVQMLTGRYGAHLDILYDEPEVTAPLLPNYRQVFYWNQTIT